MNNTDLEYFKLIDLVLSKGKEKQNRTGIPTLGVFGAQSRFNLAEGFPLLTTKKVWFKGVAHELLWFLSGSTNIKYLVDNDVHIWDDNCYARFLSQAKIHDELCQLAEGFEPGQEKASFIYRIKTDAQFAAKWGELGEGTYGGMWRSFPYFDRAWSGKPLDIHALPQEGDNNAQFVVGAVDQIQKVIAKLKSNPDDRRLIVSAWHPYWTDHCCLPPCHVLFQFHTEELTYIERLKWAGFSGAAHPDTLDAIGVPKRRLNCMMTQRSLDLPVGGPFNIASYSLLTCMVAQCVNMVPGEFIWSIGDCHIYHDQINGIHEQRAREPKHLPRLLLNPAIKSIADFRYEDIILDGYDPHPAIKMPMAV